MKIAYIGKFRNLHDEEYIARSFEKLGHEVVRIEQSVQPRDAMRIIEDETPDIAVWGKLNYGGHTAEFVRMLRGMGIVTVCWLFDLYFGYTRENLAGRAAYFSAEFVFTTDGGNDDRWAERGVRHRCVRQGICDDECVAYPVRERRHEVVFVGSDNRSYPERGALVRRLASEFKLAWYGRNDTDEARGLALNELYSESGVVVGDSFYSPHYWSNRVVETLGRGGFLIHQEVPGLKDEYPDLVTYERGNVDELREKIRYYLEHEDERREIARRNYELVKSRYTMDKKCEELLNHVKANRQR